MVTDYCFELVSTATFICHLRTKLALTLRYERLNIARYLVLERGRDVILQSCLFSCHEGTWGISSIAKCVFNVDTRWGE